MREIRRSEKRPLSGESDGLIIPMMDETSVLPYSGSSELRDSDKLFFDGFDWSDDDEDKNHISFNKIDKALLSLDQKKKQSIQN